MAGDDASALEVSMDTPISRQKILNDESSCTSEMLDYSVRKKVIVLIILIRCIMRITWWWWCHTPTQLCFCCKGKHYAGWSLILIHPFYLSLGLNLKGPLSPINWRSQKHMFLRCLMVYVVLLFPTTFGCPRGHRIFFNDSTLHKVACKGFFSHRDSHHNITWWWESFSYF